MEEPAQTARKWNGFVCPDCRHVFRVARDHDGRGVVCPSCHRMLRLPGAEDELPLLVIPGNEVAEEHETPSEVVLGEPDEFGRVKKRRRSNRQKVDEEFDETFARKKEVDPKLVRYLMGSVAVVGGVLAVALLWPDGGEVDPNEATEIEIVPVDKEESEELELVTKAERAVVRPKLVEDEILPVYRSFLNADSPEEMARWVRHPETTLPRIRKFYGDGFSPDGFSKVVWGEHPVRVGNAIKVVVQDGDFENRTIYAVDEGGWKIDWESWVGWSELSWDELKERRPTEPVLFRVVVSDVSYYNFGFTDDLVWSSYRFESLDGEHTLFGYVPRTGELDARLKSLEGIEERLLTLRIRYPDEAPSDNQVMVEEILTDEWYMSEDP